MPAKIVRSSKPAPKPRHQPGFPERQPAQTNLTPINRERVKAHYVNAAGYHGFFWAQKVTFLALALTLMAAAWWIYDRYHMAETQLAYAQIGAEMCREPTLTIPEYTCEVGALDCFTVPQQAVIERMKLQAQGVNEWRAKRCLPLMGP